MSIFDSEAFDEDGPLAFLRTKQGQAIAVAVVGLVLIGFLLLIMFIFGGKSNEPITEWPDPNYPRLTIVDEPIAESYIVMLASDKDKAEVIRTLNQQYNASLKMVYTSGINGYLASMSLEDAQKMSQDPRVEAIKQEAVFRPKKVK